MKQENIEQDKYREWIMCPVDIERTRYLMAACLIALLISVWLVVEQPTGWIITSPIVPLLVGSAASVVCAMNAGILLWYLVTSHAPLSVGSEGLVVSAGIGRYMKIPWDNIKSFEIVYPTPRKKSSNKHDLLAIHIDDPEKFINSTSGFLPKITMKYNKEKYKTPLVIALNMIGMDSHELLDFLNIRLSGV